jgi:hypothetical protein
LLITTTAQICGTGYTTIGTIIEKANMANNNLRNFFISAKEGCLIKNNRYVNVPTIKIPKERVLILMKVEDVIEQKRNWLD